MSRDTGPSAEGEAAGQGVQRVRCDDAQSWPVARRREEKRTQGESYNPKRKSVHCIPLITSRSVMAE